MNSRSITRIAWKEFRQLRLVFVVFLLLALAALAFTAFITDTNQQFQGALWCYLFAVLCGSVLFAQEHEHNTFRNLQFMPLRWGEMFLGKVAVGAAFCLVIPLVVLIAGSVADSRDTIQRNGLQNGLVIVSGVMMFFSFAMIWSLFCKRTLVAAVLAIATASLVDFAFATRFGPPAKDWFSLESYALITPYRIVLSVLAILAAIPISRHWWHGTTTEKIRQSIAEKALGQASPQIAGGGFWSMSARLFWQSIHAEYRSICVIALLVYGTALVAIFAMPLHFAAPVFIGAGIVACWLGGVFSFAADQHKQSYRFFVQHREHPRLVWLVRNLVWQFILLLFICTGWLMVTGFAQTEFNDPPLALFSELLDPWGYSAYAALGDDVVASQSYLFGGFIIAALFTVFAAGQLASMQFRSSIVAGFVSAIVVAVCLFWALTASLFQVPWWWSVLPLGTVMLALSFWWAPKWFGEAPAPIGWAASAGAFAVALIVLIISASAYRTNFVPPQTIAWSFDQEDSDELIREAREKYYHAFDEYNYFPETVPYSSFRAARIGQKIEPEVLAIVAEWLESNEVLINRLEDAVSFVEANRKEFQTITPWNWREDPSRSVPPFDKGYENGISRTLAHMARGYIETGDTANAAKVIELMLRFRQQGAWFFSANWIHRYASSSWIDAWTYMPDITEAQLESMMRVMQETEIDPIDARRRNLYVEYQVLLYDAKQQNEHVSEDERQWLVALRESIAALSSVEKTNAANLASQWIQTELDVTENLAIKMHLQSPIDWYDRRGYDRRMRRVKRHRHYKLAKWQFWTSSSVGYGPGGLGRLPGDISDLTSMVLTQRKRRAVLTKLALMLYKKREGRYPQSLDDLVTAGILEFLPVDPATYREFAYYPNGLSKPVYREIQDYGWYRPEVAPEQPFLVVAPNASLIEKEVYVLDEDLDPNWVEETATRAGELKVGFVSPSRFDKSAEFSGRVLALPMVEDE